MSNLLSIIDFKKPLSLYIHIPFCTSKCSYCAFYSKPGISECEKRKYTERICREIDSVTAKMEIPFSTAYIGGGNPGCLPVGCLEKIAAAVCRKGRPEEFTVEMNPENLSECHFSLFESYFTRLSMGIQSFNEEALMFLGRNADVFKTNEGVDKALKLRSLYGTSINFDLITCLGSFHDYESDVRKMINLCPDHISVYALTLEEGTPLYLKNPELPDSDLQYLILSRVWKLLENSGYEHYEVSNFAKFGMKSKHNETYWNYRQYLGLGSHSASTLISDKKYFRVNCTEDFETFSKGDLFEGYQVDELSTSEAREEFVLMGMRHKRGLDLQRLKEEFGLTLSVVPAGYRIVSGFLVPDDSGLMTADSAALCVDSSF